jgi:hypothetical protein
MHSFERTLRVLAGQGKILFIEAQTQFDSLLAARVLRKYMPALSAFERCYLDQTYAVAGMHGTLAPKDVPLRAPHYTAGAAALAGRHGGNLRHTPGELDLAAGGVLLLDEFLGFRLDAIRLLGEEFARPAPLKPMIVAAIYLEQEFDREIRRLERCAKALVGKASFTSIALPALSCDERDKIFDAL